MCCLNMLVAFSIAGLVASAVSTLVFEAETGTFVGGVYVATDLPGFSGTGYATNFTASGTLLTIPVTGLSAGFYDINVKFSAQYGSKYTSMSVNGAATVEVALTNVTTSNWDTSTAGSFPLTSGTNTVSFADDWGWYFIDSITVAPTPAKTIISVNVTIGATAEAENGILGGTTVDTSTAGYSGVGYITGFTTSASNLTFTLFSQTEALYNLVIRYGGIYGGKQTKMSLNGQGGAEVVLADTSAAASPWANATAGQILLNAGNNTVTFIDDW